MFIVHLKLRDYCFCPATPEFFRGLAVENTCQPEITFMEALPTLMKIRIFLSRDAHSTKVLHPHEEALLLLPNNLNLGKKPLSTLSPIQSSFQYQKCHNHHCEYE